MSGVFQANPLLGLLKKLASFLLAQYLCVLINLAALCFWSWGYNDEPGFLHIPAISK